MYCLLTVFILLSFCLFISSLIQFISRFIYWTQNDHVTSSSVFKGIQRFQEVCKRYSKVFKGFQEVFKGIQRYSKVFKRYSKVFKDIQRFSKVFKGIQRSSKVFKGIHRFITSLLKHLRRKKSCLHNSETIGFPLFHRLSIV